MAEKKLAYAKEKEKKANEMAIATLKLKAEVDEKMRQYEIYTKSEVICKS